MILLLDNQELSLPLYGIRNDEVGSSILLGSTIPSPVPVAQLDRASAS